MKKMYILSKNVYSESEKTVVTLSNIINIITKKYEQRSKTNTFRNE